jgi:nucleotide-binding universal stress UspA family protein
MKECDMGCAKPGYAHSSLLNRSPGFARELHMYEKILVPLDGSGRAEAILRHVEAIALPAGSQVIFLLVIEPPPVMLDSQASPIALIIDELQQHENEARQYLAARQGEFRARGIDSKTLIAHGPVVKLIIDTAETEDVGLIAMASHGRTGLANLFYGSVTLGVLHRTDRPVLIIRSVERV